jgi:hypothetical protein
MLIWLERRAEALKVEIPVPLICRSIARHTNSRKYSAYGRSPCFRVDFWCLAIQTTELHREDSSTAVANLQQAFGGSMSLYPDSYFPGGRCALRGHNYPSFLVASSPPLEK